MLLIIYFSVCFVSYHHQVVKLIDVFPYGTGFVLVFEYMLSDLSEVLRNSARPLTEVGTLLNVLQSVSIYLSFLVMIHF